ncbi:MAG: efflux RND transporter permease subunit [Paludibacter sp.]
MKFGKNLIEATMKHKSISLLIAGVLVLFGIYALQNMPRQEFPTFTIRQGLVIGMMPGATSSQVEEQLSSKVEEFLFGFKEINKKKTYSISKEGMMIVFVELNDNVKDADAFWSKFKHELNLFKMQLPPEVMALIANTDFGDTSALLLTIQSDERSYGDLENYLTSLETELRKIDAVSKIKHYGLQNEQISIYLQSEKLAYYGVKPITILAALRTESNVSYAGELDNNHYSQPIHIAPRYQSEKDIAEQIVYTDPFNNIVRLKDIARIERKYTTPDSYLRTNGKQCLLLSMEMQQGNNIVQFGKEVDQVLEKFSKQLPPDVKIEKVVDAPKFVNASITNFMKEFGMAILGVIIVIIILLPFRVAMVPAITLPITIFISIGFLYAFGYELDTVTLAILMVVLGMVVDNAIVVVDNHVEKLDHGKSPWEAAVNSASTLFLPVTTASLAIIATFFPTIFFLDGIIGDFCGPIPATISIALGTSILVVVFVLPTLNAKLLKKGIMQNSEQKKNSILNVFQNLYNKWLDRAFKYPRTVIGIGIFSVILGAAIALTMDEQFLPRIGRDQFAVEVYLAQNSSLAQTDSVISSLEKLLLKDKRVTNVTSFIGTSSPRFHATYAPNLPSPNYGQLIVNTLSNESTVEILEEYNTKYRDYYPQAYIKWKQLDMLAAQSPIEVRISGDSISDLKETADKVKTILRDTKGIAWVRDDYEEKRQGIAVQLNNDEANRLGFTKSFIAASLAIGTQGLPITTLWEGDKQVDVKLLNDKNDNTIKSLEDQYITSPFMTATVPLRQVATLVPEWTEGQIIRRNGVRTLTVRADMERNVLAFSVFPKIKKAISKIDTKPTVNISYGGEHENEIKNYTPLIKSLIVSIVLIFFILLFQFKKIRTALVIMVSMPLAVLGTVLGLKIMGYPFGATALLGVISLVGIVVRNGIIMIDYAETLRKKEGLSVFEAAVASAKRRMRPIFLTSAAASVGVIPMILSNSPLWAPMGTVMCFGLIVSMVLTLFVLPILYWLVFKHEDKKQLLINPIE